MKKDKKNAQRAEFVILTGFSISLNNWNDSKSRFWQQSNRQARQGRQARQVRQEQFSFILGALGGLGALGEINERPT